MGYLLLNTMIIQINANVGGMKSKRTAKKPFSRCREIGTGNNASITTKTALFYTTC